MTPYKFTIKDGVTTFHYRFADLRYYVTRGNSHGDVGPLLKSRKGGRFDYWMYGTIDHPCTTRQHCNIGHFEPFDGPEPSDQEIVTPPVKKEPDLSSYSFFMFDMKEAKHNIINLRKDFL